MKAKGQTHEWNSESRVRENRLHGLMRGRKPERQCKQQACPPRLLLAYSTELSRFAEGGACR
jgi:hypothetical protein